MKTCHPEEVGFSSERLARLRPALQSFVDANQAPGFHVVIARKGKLVFKDCIGWRDRESNAPVAGNELYRIYSMTKPVMATALMMLYEEGRVLLQAPVSQYIPAFKHLKVYAGKADGKMKLEAMQREITILDLVLHTSGLGYGLACDSPVEDMFRASGMARHDLLSFLLPLDETVRLITGLPLINQPGTRWRYSIGMDVTGYLVQLISGLPLDVFMQERIFEPLGMSDTGFYVPAEKLKRLATLYSPGKDGKIDAIDRGASSPFANPNAVPSGGGGLVSTTHDYLRFAQMLLNEGELDGTRVLGARTVARMRRNHLPVALLPINLNGFAMPGIGFGPGFGVNMDDALSNFAASDGSYYWGGAASTTFYVDPVDEIAAVLMTQVLNNMIPFDVVFRQLVRQAIVE